MAITYLGTASSAVNSAAATTIDITHTVTAGTELVLLAGLGRDEAISSVGAWNGTDTWVEVVDFAGSGANDIDLKVWAIVNPTAATDTITVTLEASCTWQAVCMANFAGNVTTSEAAAVSLDNLAYTPPATFANPTTVASGGSSGNGLVVVGGHISDEGDNTSSINNSFVEIIDVGTGGGDAGNSDGQLYMAYLLDAAPSGASITWGGNNYGNAALLEIVSASAGATSITAAGNTSPLNETWDDGDTGIQIIGTGFV